jgi:hypothetical protein
MEALGKPGVGVEGEGTVGDGGIGELGTSWVVCHARFAAAGNPSRAPASGKKAVPFSIS